MDVILIHFGRYHEILSFTSFTTREGLHAFRYAVRGQVQYFQRHELKSGQSGQHQIKI